MISRYSPSKEVDPSKFVASINNGPSYPSQKPINPEASPNARIALQYLYSIKGQKTLSGQHNWIDVPYNSMITVKNEQGDYPVIQDAELGLFEPTYTIDQYKGFLLDLVSTAVTHFERGGITSACWHMSYPTLPRSWANVQRSATTNAEFDQIITPGTAGYQWVINEIDMVAPYLKMLRDKDIPFILRPFHEMNGQWFWWGCKDNFVQLWDIMYDRLVNVHQCHNILWMWNWNAPNGYTDANTGIKIFEFNDPRTFGGVNKADIFAIDIYNKDYKQKYHDDMMAVVDGKIMAIGENGMLPTPEIMAAQPHWAWFATWTNYWTLEGNTSATRTATYSDPRVLTVSEVGAKPPFAGYAGDIISYLPKDAYPETAKDLPSKPKAPGQIAIYRGSPYIAIHANDKTGWMQLSPQGLPILSSPSGSRFILKVDDAGALFTDRLTVFKDSATRADNSSSIGAPEIGTWVAESGTWGIKNNKIVTITGYNNDHIHCNVGITDYMFKCNVSAQLGGFNRADLLIKLTTNEAGTWWADYLGLSFSSLYCNLNKHVGTSDTTIKSVPLPFAIKTGQEISVVTICKGNEITVYVEDIETMRYTMSSAEQAIFAAATRVGLRHVKSSNFTVQATWDDIVVEKL